MRLSAKGRLEMGDVPRAARVMKAMPQAAVITPSRNTRYRRCRYCEDMTPYPSR